MPAGSPRPEPPARSSSRASPRKTQAQPDLSAIYSARRPSALCPSRHKPAPGGAHMDETFPDLGSLTDMELKDVIRQLTEEETEISYKRRLLHGKIDILRAELVNRLRKKHEGGEEVISGADVQRLTDILAGRATGAGDDTI